jgi:ligand-binding sensor domain-containing protein
MTTFFRFLLIGAFLLGLFPVSAQKYYYAIYDEEDNIPFRSAHSIIEGPKGYIWIAGAEGLFRFNGKIFEDFSTSLKSKNIYALDNWKKDTLLFVNDAGLFRLFYDDRQVRIQTFLESELIKNEGALYYPNGLFVDSQFNIWISQSDHSLARWQNGSLHQYPFSEQAPDTPHRIFIREDASGRIWAASQSGRIAFYDPDKDQFESVLKTEPIRAFQVFGDTIWTGGQAIQLFNIRSGGRLQPLLQKSIPGTINSITQDLQGQFLLATKEGELFICPTAQQLPVKVFGSNDPHRVEELPFDQVNSLYVTQDPISPSGAIWVATQQGLGLLQLRYFEGVENLANNNVFSLATDHKNTVFINFGKLNAIEKKGNQFEITPYENQDRVVAVAANEQNLWASTAEYEILQMKNGNTSKRFDLSWRGGEIFYMFCDADENLWICQAPTDRPLVGVAKITPAGKVIEYGPASGLNNRILVVEQSSRKELYAAGIGPSTYLYRYFPEKDTFENLSLPMPFEVSSNFEVHDLSIDPRGVVWLATTNGLLQFDSENIRRIALGPYTGEEIRGVCALEDGSIWAATATDGLVYFKDEQYVLYDESCGLPSVVNSYRCLVRDGDNRIWAGTAEGAVFSLNDHPVPAQSAEPIIHQLELNGRPIQLDTDRGLSFSREARLFMEFISLAYPGEHTTYAYRLIPKNGEADILEGIPWQTLSVNNTIEIKGEPAGEYFLQVRARQSGGFQWSSPLSIPITVFTVWYKRWWFAASLLLLGVIIFWSYIRVFLFKRLKILEQVSSNQKKELAKKQALLDAKTQEVRHQRAAFEATISNLSRLHLIISKIPLEADWKEVITALGKAIDESIGIHAFEIAYVHEDEFYYHGYSMKEQGGFSFRSQDFDEKKSLAAWAMSNEEQVIINDFRLEHTQYVEKKEDYHFQSMIFIPFKFRNGQAAVLCAYNIRKNQFQEQDALMLQLLTDYIALSTTGDFGEKSP